MDWIKRLMPTASKVQNLANLPAPVVNTLTQEFSKLSKFGSNMPESILCFILDNANPEILIKLSGLRDAASLMGFQIINGYGKRVERSELWNKIRIEDAGVLMRIALVYEAISRTGSPTLRLAPWPSWMEVFLFEAYRGMPNSYPPTREDAVIDAMTLRQMCVINGDDPTIIVRGACEASSPYDHRIFFFLALKNFARLSHEDVDVFRKMLGQKTNAGQTMALLANPGMPVEKLIIELADLMLASSKRLREQAEGLLQSRKTEVRPILEQRLTNKKAADRLAAVQALYRFFGKEILPTLQEHAKKESAKAIVDEIESFVANPIAAATELSSQIPDPIPQPADTDLSEETRDLIASILREANNNARQDQKQRYGKIEVMSDSHIGTVLKALKPGLSAKDIVPLKDPRSFFSWHNQILDARLAKEIFPRSDFTLRHFIRWNVVMGGIVVHPRNPHGELWGFQNARESFRRKTTHPFGLLELAQTFDSMGLESQALANDFFAGYGRSWDAKLAWPYFARNVEILEQVITKRGKGVWFQSYWAGNAVQKAYQVLQCFPALPPSLMPIIWEQAFGATKFDRELAQGALATVQGKEERILKALSSGKKEVRAFAAEWLGRLGYKKAIPVIKKAIETEKAEMVTARFLLTLERLGEPLDAYLDTKKLESEAESVLKNGLPSQLSFLDPKRLPPVQWKKGGKVTPVILQQFLVNSYKSKDVNPGPLMRLYCDMFDEKSRQDFGQFVLESWIAHDTAPTSPAEAMARAEQQAKAYHQYYKNTNLEQLIQQFYKNLVVTPVGSATESKGVLAVAAATCGARAVAVVERYLKDWYGMRPAQCKALLQVLQWIDHPQATQLLISVSRKFRTRGIQKEAERLVLELATRNDWTIDELADRTMPTAGLDERGAFVADYGSRQFQIRLSEDMSLIATDENGKTLKNLPDARKEEDPEKVKEIKKEFASAKKELAGVLKHQSDRLYEAMCTMRRWNPDDWEKYIVGHPIVSRLAQRLLWAQFDAKGKLISIFRILDDRSYTDAKERELTLNASLTVGLVHSSIIGKEDRASWKKHLVDYKVIPLFEQLSEHTHDLSDEQKELTELSLYKGFMIEAFKMRGLATKFGYTRGPAEDGGWFFSYLRLFPGLGLEAVIEFSGNSLPEENRSVALTRLVFRRQQKEQASYSEREMTLGEIPEILLSETWNHMKTMADAGTGYAADWEKRAYS